MRNLSPESVRQLLDNDTPRVLLDVREKWEFEICHIKPSINVPMQEVPLAIQGFDPGTETVVICHHGSRSMQVANYLENAGFTNVINLEGGVDAWADSVEPGMQKY